MIPFLATLPHHPYDLVRVEDPAHPEADARSASGALLLSPPTDGTPWRWEHVPVNDAWIGEEAIEATSVAPWIAAGSGGAGVRVAVFDSQWFGHDLDALGVASRDCYAHPSCEPPIDTLRARFGFEEGAHGVACAELVRAVAPEAEVFAVRVNSLTTLENAVSWAIRERIDVISMSLSFFNASFYDGTGPITAQADRLATAGILLVTSAGNYARGHWRGAWTDGDGDGRLDGDGANGLDVYLPEGASRGPSVSWNQYRSCGATDLDVLLRDASGRIVARGEAEQRYGDESCAPSERLRGPFAAGWYRLEVHHRAGASVGLQVDVLNNGGELRGADPGGSITDPAVHPGVFAVGAVRAAGYLTNPAESFSSRGPVAGGWSKPDIAGPNGLTTRAYGPVGFYGTSASTPVVAGLIAVILGDRPELSPLEAGRRLQAWAWTDGVPAGQVDPALGAGRARLPDPAPEARGCAGGALLPLLLPWGWRRRVRGG